MLLAGCTDRVPTALQLHAKLQLFCPDHTRNLQSHAAAPHTALLPRTPPQLLKTWKGLSGAEEEDLGEGMKTVLFGLGGCSYLFILTVYLIYILLGAHYMAQAWTSEDAT